MGETHIVNVTPEVTDSGLPEQAPANVQADPNHPQRLTVNPEQPGAPETPAENARPEWAPEKFWDAEKGEVNVEQLAQSYAELERGRATEEQTTEPQTPPPAGQDAMTKLQPFFDEFAEGNGLSEESYKKLQDDFGYPKELVDGYISGQLAQTEAAVQQIYQEVGGQDKYAEMAQWAGANLEPTEVQGLNAMLESGDMNQVLAAVRGLQARFQTANGVAPNLLQGRAPSNATGLAPFRSRAEMTSAMGDPRYRTDPAYRGEVEARLGISEL